MDPKAGQPVSSRTGYLTLNEPGFAEPHMPS